ncbi:MAG: hypothetical protein FK730_16565 [Asgard group archaeon]|nr:hypothetical protein [Asgard group archaeon]
MEMGKKKIKIIILISYTILFAILPVFCSANIMTTTQNPPPYFMISILVHENDTKGISLANIISEHLAVVGIGIDTIHTANWSEIYQRTTYYPGPYPIPSFSEGGYDILSIGFTSELDFNPKGLYDAPSITPFDDNFYQYFSFDMDFAIYNFSQSFNKTDRMYWANEIQALLYEDVPSIAVAYPQTLFIHDSNLNNWDPLLWYKDYQSMSDWSIPQETTFNYAQGEISDDFHIYFCDDKSEAQWLNQIYTGLVERKSDLDGFFGTNIATDWVTTNGLTYTVNLHPNATWADGVPLNASDIVYTYDLINKISYSSYIFERDYLNTSITVIDKDTLEFEFPTKYVFNENVFALPIMPKHIWNTIAPENHSKQAEDWVITNPMKLMGAGPYYLFDYNNDSNIVHLKQNEYYKNYTGINPHFEDIYFKYYSNKESALTDIDTGVIDFIDPQFTFCVEDVPVNASFSLSFTGNVQQLAINNLSPWIGTGELCPINSPESAKYLRKAISYAIPREIIINDVFNGLASPGVTPWSNIALDFDELLEPVEYNLDYSKYLTEMAGFYYGTIPFPCTSTTPIIGLSFGLILIISISTIIAISYLVKKKR